MKKFILSSLAAFCMLSVSAQDELCAEPLHMAANSTANLVINLKNDHYVRGIQFAIILPEGFDTARGKKTMTVGTDYTLLDRAADVDAIIAVCQRKANTDGSIQINYAGGPAIDPEADVDNVEAGEGGVFSFPIKTTAAAGVYPISVRVDEVSDSEGGLYIQNKYYTSYIVVGDAKGAYAAANILPASVNEVLAADANVTAVDLSAVTDVNGEFAYVDGRAVVGTEATASLKYEGDKANYYSVNVPFDAAISGTGKVYEFKGAANGWATFEPATSVEANKTYLAEGAVTLTAASAKVAPVQNLTDASGSYVKDGTFYHGTGLTVPATRGLFNVPPGSNLRVVVDGVVTNITTAQIEAGEASYDLQGRQTTNAKNGVFVVNGKKQFVK